MPAPLELSDDDRAVLNRVARMLARRRLTSPALMLLEMSRPINFIASQFLVFMHPFATALLNPAEYGRFTRILEHREGMDALIDAITTCSTDVQPEPAAGSGLKAAASTADPAGDLRTQPGATG